MYRKPAIILTIIAALLAIISGFLEYGAYKARQEQVRQFNAVQEKLVYAKSNATKEDVREEITKASKEIETLKHEKKGLSEKAVETPMGESLYRFVPKLIFSTIILVAALYVILSNKYGEETQKWAFSMIGVIVGVWIGGQV
ncbi:MAG TPA: hypothetical protein VF708_01670 [Pyrinomonadaceae bacterium]|jgi:archaellum component FlaF (FlaF/FlaG flagellin family)